MARSEKAMWEEYDMVAFGFAKRHGRAPRDGDPLPDFIGGDVHELINDDPEAFAKHVRSMLYAIARTGARTYTELVELTTTRANPKELPPGYTVFRQSRHYLYGWVACMPQKIKP